VNFDFANPDMTSGKRHETTVPQQALFFMNSPLVVEQARKLVSREEFEQLSSDTGRIDYLYQRIYQRPPRPEEIKLGQEFVAEQPSREKVTLASAPGSAQVRGVRKNPNQAVRQANRKGGGRSFKEREPLNAWEEYAHALLQANEASFVN
jgi:hypothetical protein